MYDFIRCSVRVGMFVSYIKARTQIEAGSVKSAEENT